MKYFDTFTGIGGFTLGIIKSHENLQNNILQQDKGWSNKLSSKKGEYSKHTKVSIGESEPICVGFSEIDKYATKVYKHHFPNHKEYGDITAIDTDTLPDFDCLTGGFPCQSFSIAGKRGGFEDTRGTLFFELARILRDKRPRLFVFENVKGLLSHDEGNTFKTIISTLDELGYFVEWQVLNSKNFGVPQNRERVFIVGHLGGEPRRKVFPLGSIDEETDELQGQQGIANTITTRSQLAGGSGAYIVERELDAQEIKIKSNTRAGFEVAKEGDSVNFKNLASKTRRGRVGNGVAQTIETTNQQGVVVPVLTPDRPEKRQNGRRFKEDGEESFTLTAQDKHGIFNGSRIRRLTPLECERLQGFPDNWTNVEQMSDSQRYKQCGNAVTVNVIEAIFEKLV